MTAVVIDIGRGGMEPMAPMGVSLTAVAVDGSGGNSAVPATLDDNDDTMASVAMVSLTNGGGAVAMVVIVINCAAAVDAATAILLSLLTAVAKMPSPPLPSTIAAVNDSGNGGRQWRG